MARTVRFVRCDRLVLCGLVAAFGLRCSGGRIGASGASSADNTVGVDGGHDILSLHRLNRVEYNNSVRDLLATTSKPADSFPADDIAHGFDNLADALNTSPAAISLYAQAAQSLSFAAMNPNSPGYVKVKLCDPGQGAWETCAQTIFAAFATKAWRRPVTTGELDALVSIVHNAQTQGLSFDDSIATGLSQILFSPHFIYRIESRAADGPSAASINDYEMAARLSYFIWSTTPDDALLAAAQAGALQSDGDLTAQLDRMLADPKASQLMDNFAGQWLRLRDITSSSPDATLFANYTPAIGQLMAEETKAFVRSFIEQDLPAAQMLTADYTYLNDTLAQYYGLPAPGSATLVQTQLGASDKRQGLMTQGAILTVTSHPDAGSPVLRGKFILAQLLCKPPPAPPANVPSLPDVAPTDKPQTMRQRISQHVTDPVCAGCHLLIDPPGFSLEGFDAVGNVRQKDNGLPIDTTGTMLDGTSFTDIRDLSAKLSQGPAFAACLTEFMYVFATGHSMQDWDIQQLAQLTTQLASKGFGVKQIVRDIVLSDGFRKHAPLTTSAP